MRVMPFTEDLPYALYRAEQVREFDRIAIQEFEIPGAELMERAGGRAFQLMQMRWPQAARITVICGAGNNGGDGYVLARLALKAGLQVELRSLADPAKLEGDAQVMADAWRELGGEILPYAGFSRETELIVDAILGTGLEREVSGVWAEAIEAINHHPAAVLAIDIPSGLNSDNGRIMGNAIRADATLSFIGLKQGMFTGAGPDCCGEIHYDALEIPARIFARQILAARRIDWHKLGSQISPRRRTSHKGDLGHVLVIGGNLGYSGAARLAGEAALRSGAGLVSVATHPEHAKILNLGRPELMCRGMECSTDLQPLLARARVIALGPGLGQDDWARSLFQAALNTNLPLVVDADALNLLAGTMHRRDAWVLTPHPGEAARLLKSDTRTVQLDRFAALQRLQAEYGGVVVLKGAGSLVGSDGSRPPAVCSGGNPGMASGGSGDLLTGLIAGLVAQGYELADAAELGVALHAAAGDRAARNGEIGMLAGDMLAELRALLNEGQTGAEA